VLEAYAMTEAAHQMTSNPLPPGKRIAGSVGVGQGVEVRILDQRGEELPVGKEGEICIRGENVTRGYLNNEKANKESFTRGDFFRTGDQGKMDERGYLYITGRIKELVNKGGEKISPVEIDNVVTQHPAVSEAVSFAIDDEIYGQDVGLAVVLKDGQKLVADGLREWLAERIVKFKLPKKVSLFVLGYKELRRTIDADDSHRYSSSTSCRRQQQARFREGRLQWRCLKRRRPKQSCEGRDGAFNVQF
jgi:oxalate---CoA ligase